MTTTRKRLLLCLATLALVGSGCTTTVTTAQMAAGIRLGAATSTAIGLVAVPDQAEATQIATLGKSAVDQNVLPALQSGDQAAVAAGLKKILALEAFNAPELAKFKAIASYALPILTSMLPPGLLDEALTQVPPDVLLYVTSFFQGVSDGAGAYLGMDKDLRSQLLREKLSQVLKDKILKK